VDLKCVFHSEAKETHLSAFEMYYYYCYISYVICVKLDRSKRTWDSKVKHYFAKKIIDAGCGSEKLDKVLWKRIYCHNSINFL